MSMTFEITEDQEKIIEKWYKDLEPKILEIENGMFNRELLRHGPYYGTIGGGLAYSFIPTGLGTIIKVKEYITKEEIDITDYSSW